MKQIYSLNYNWKFQKTSELKTVTLNDYFNMFNSDAKTGIRSDYLSDSWYDNDWETVSLPHDWVVGEDPTPGPECTQGYKPRGEVVYRKTFTLSKELYQKRIFLKFDAIAIKSKIYLNGILVARSECGYTPVFVEITDFIETDKQIVIAVVADSSVKEGWWYEGGGIYGNAYLIATEKSKFLNDGIFVSPELIGDSKWRIKISAEIDGEFAGLRAEYKIDCINLGIENKFNDTRASAEMIVENPKLWSIDEPNLYTMNCFLYKDDELIDSEEITFGFRTVTFDVENGCLLNGKPIKLKGVCLHHDHAGVGVAVTYDIHKYRLQKLKQMHCNAIRTSHNPQLKEFYRACDELGILVMNETRHFSSTEECLNQLEKFVKRDRNHPCVIMWSLFNEEPLQCTKIGRKMFETMKKTVNKHDGTRPVTGGMNGPLEPEGVVSCVDITGFNYLQYGYEPFHQIHPDMPIIGSETGSYLSTRHSAYTDDKKIKRCSFENELGKNRYQWSASPGDTWKNIEDKSYVLGGFYWTGFDYRGESGSFPSVVSSFGAMDLCGFPKECFYMHRAVWSEEPTIDAVYYENYKKQGDMLINCYTNCNKIALYIDNEFYDEYESNKYEPLSIYIEEFCGKEFEVKGIENEKEVCSYFDALPELPYSISAELSKNALLSDGEDICIVDVYLSGKNSKKVLNANNLMEFSVTGGGKIIGVGNGDNSDLTSEKADCKNLYEGYCQLIVQSNGKKEDTHIKIYSKDIGESDIVLKCIETEEKPYILSERGRISILTWMESDVHCDYPTKEQIGNFSFCWIPTTIGYGKNFMYSGKEGFGTISGKAVIPSLAENEEAVVVFDKITGDFDIYFDKDLIYSGTDCTDLRIPVNKFQDNMFITVVFKLNGGDCGICGKACVRIGEKMNSGIVLFDNVRFSVITENLIRCEHSKNKSFCDNDTLFAVNRKYDGCKYNVEETETSITVSTDTMSITYEKNEEDSFTAKNLYGILSGAEWNYGDKNKENLGGTLSTLDDVEGYTKVDDGILSKDGWFVYDDSKNLIIEDEWIKVNYDRNETDIYIFSYGKDYRKALKTLFYVSGKPALPRKYVFGSWYSRWWPYSDEEIKGIVDGYDEHDFPLDIMVIDMDWHHHDWTYEDNDEGKNHKAQYGYGHAGNLGWTGYSWNKNLIKNPAKLLKELHDRNIHITLNDHPHDGIRTHEDAYEEFMRDMGIEPKSNVNLEFDLSSKKYMQAFFQNAHEPLEKDGVDFWWVDWQQDHLKPYIKGTFTPHLKWLNPCYFKHTSKNGKRGLSYSRWAGLGDHKYPIYFSGDTKSTWECLKFEVEFTQSSSNSGLFYWGHDTGGFFGDRDSEMYVRWTQFTAFSACLRVHSQRDELLDRCPWKWGIEAEDAMRKVYHMRSQLIPYIYSVAYKAYDEGEPMIKPMYIEYPDEEEAYKNAQQYMFGNEFICAPVTEPMKDGKATQKVWIKEGTYYNFFTNEMYENGTHEISCSLDEFPLLVRGGIPVPMQPYSKRMTSEKLNELIIRCYPGEKGEFILYEDDGISDKYLEDKNLKTKLSYKNEDGIITLEIEPFGDGYHNMPKTRDYTIELPLTEKKMKVINDTDCEIEFENDCNIVKVRNKYIYEKITITLLGG